MIPLTRPAWSQNCRPAAVVTCERAVGVDRHAVRAALRRAIGHVQMKVAPLVRDRAIRLNLK